MSVEQLFKFEIAKLCTDILTACYQVHLDTFLIKTFKKAIGLPEKLKMLRMFFKILSGKLNQSGKQFVEQTGVFLCQKMKINKIIHDDGFIMT